MSVYIYYGRTLKFFVKHFKHLCELPTEAEQGIVRRHSSPKTAAIYVDQSRKSGLLNMESWLDPTCIKYILKKTERILGNESFRQPLRTCIFWIPYLCHEEEISHIWPKPTSRLRVTFQFTAFGKPRHSDIMSQCSRTHWVL